MVSARAMSVSYTHLDVYKRQQLNMTQETLAELAHVTPQTISTAELGQKAMRPETILKRCV